MVECIRGGDCPLAFIVRACEAFDQTVFLTSPEAGQQVGFIVRSGGDEVARHSHPALERRSQGSSEVLVVRSGLCDLDLYDDDRRLVATRRLTVGDVVLL